MKLELRRTHLNDRWTLGELWVDGAFAFFSCEDVTREPGVKVWGETAIPLGTYAIKLQRSPTWKRLMAYLQDVPGFSKVMIHPGNDHTDSLGCILVGAKRDIPGGRVLDSRVAFDRLYPRIAGACSKGGVSIAITHAFVVSDMRNSKAIH